MKQFSDTLFCRTYDHRYSCNKESRYFFFEIHIKLLFPFIGFKSIRYDEKFEKFSNLRITIYCIC